jgi:hypothetical protein
MSEALDQNRSKPQPNAPQPGRGKVWVVVDASSGAYGSTTPGAKPQVENLEALLAEHDAYGIGHDAVADATLRHRIEEAEGNEGVERLDRLFREGKVYQAPAGVPADLLAIQLARKRKEQGYKVFIATNDQYKEHPGGNGFPKIGFIVTREGWVLSHPEIKSLPQRVPAAVVGETPTSTETSVAATVEGSP